MPNEKTQTETNQVEMLLEILKPFPLETIRIAIEAIERNNPGFFVGNNGCRGHKLDPVDIEEKIYYSNYFVNNDKFQKAKIISEFLKKFTNQSLCINTTECKEQNEQCIPISLKHTVTDKGKADMTLMKGTLFGEEIGQYLLRVTSKKAQIQFTTGCKCIKQKAI